MLEPQGISKCPLMTCRNIGSTSFDRSVEAVYQLEIPRHQEELEFVSKLFLSVFHLQQILTITPSCLT
jgi:hypothetical protein